MLEIYTMEMAYIERNQIIVVKILCLCNKGVRFWANRGHNCCNSAHFWVIVWFVRRSEYCIRVPRSLTCKITWSICCLSSWWKAVVVPHAKVLFRSIVDSHPMSDDRNYLQGCTKICRIRNYEFKIINKIEHYCRGHSMGGISEKQNAIKCHPTNWHIRSFYKICTTEQPGT